MSPIGSTGSTVRRRADNVLNHIIRPAAAAVNLAARRADDIDAPGSITSQIIQRLLSAKAVVLDLTDRNPNVYYELAIRDSFGLPVVLVAENGTELASDIVGQRTIFFDSTDLGSVAVAIPRITQALTDALANPAGASPVHAAAQLGQLSTGNAEQQAVAQLVAEFGRLRRDFDLLRRHPIAQPLEELELSIRDHNALKRAGINTVEDLQMKSEHDLTSHPQIGAKNLASILSALADRGFELRK